MGQLILHGVPHFAISIALKDNNEIISGLIYDPIKDEMFYAEKNNGILIIKELEFQKRNILDECLFVTGGKINKEYQFSYRKSGSEKFDLAYVASGRYDGYFKKI